MIRGCLKYSLELFYNLVFLGVYGCLFCRDRGYFFRYFRGTVCARLVDIIFLFFMSFDNRYISGSRFFVFLDFNLSYFFRKFFGVRENFVILILKV